MDKFDKKHIFKRYPGIRTICKKCGKEFIAEDMFRYVGAPICDECIDMAIKMINDYNKKESAKEWIF